ncbi:MAG TPA: hypothetical protein VLE95_01845, partial [Chlamydiales bacterium]|nr:hypothetical protein [Chlamydiales bacterium]
FGVLLSRFLVLFAGVVSNFVYNPRKKNQKSAKIIPKIDEAWVLGQLLRNLMVIRKLSSGHYRLYSRKKNPKTGKKRNLGTFSTLAGAKQHEREIQYFKRRG